MISFRLIFGCSFGGTFLRMSTSDRKVVLFLAMACSVAGLIIAAVGEGIPSGSWPGAVCAAVGIPLSLYGIWIGVQRQTQTFLAMGVCTLLLSVGATSLLVIMKLIDVGRGAIS